jgi:hypothetical protein
MRARGFLVVLVLTGCAEVSESGSSQRAQPSKKSPLIETAEYHASTGKPANCNPTQPDMLGPFYEPGAPVQSSVGSGYVLFGRVLAAEECKPIPNAPIEFWLANPRVFPILPAALTLEPLFNAQPVRWGCRRS